MEILTSLLLLVLGFVLLVKGADFFVDGAAGIAKKLRIPAFVIGLTVVAFGTSAPELAVSLSAAIKGNNDIAMGNVVGSNLFNLLVVLGLSAVITPIAVKKHIIKVDYPISLFITLILAVLCADTLFGKEGMSLDRIDGIFLLIVFAIFMFITIKDGIKNRDEVEEDEEDSKPKPFWLILIMTAVGLAAIIWGGDITVDAAVAIASELGLSDALIGLTVIALGTSLPELVTSIIAARKDESDIAVGNVIGSNIFNILLILGTSSTILPMNIGSSYLYDIAILLGVSIFAFVPIIITKKVSRSFGAVMVLAYALYMTYLVLRQVQVI